MARGHHYHVRVVINGQYAYDRGGDACRFILYDMDRVPHGKNYDPLNTTTGQDAFGLHYVDENGTTIGIERTDVAWIRLIFITRTRTGKRRIDMAKEYYYANGTMTHFITIPGPSELLDKDDKYYREGINYVSIRDIYRRKG